MRKILKTIFILFIIFNSIQSEGLYTNPKVVKDIDLIHKILNQNFSTTDSSTIIHNFLQYGIYQISFKNDSTRSLILLHNGTEVKRLNKTETQKIIKSFPFVDIKKENLTEKLDSDTITDGKNGTTRIIDTRPIQEKLLGLGKWKNKIELSEQFNMINAGTYITRLTTDLQLNNRHKFLYYGAGLTVNTLWGVLADTIDNKHPNYGGSFGFNLSIGLPFIKYTLRNADEKIPYYAWLGNDIYALFLNGKGNSNFTIYKDSLNENHSWNMEHQFNIKIWNFHYDLIIDGDTYKNPIHIIAFEDMGTFFGTWDLRVIKSTTVWIPGFRFTTKDIHLKNFKYKNIRLPLSTSIIYTDVYYKNFSQFNIAFGMKIKLGIEDGVK